MYFQKKIMARTIYTPLILMMIMIVAAARDLRPSDHGLEYQSKPPLGEKSPPEVEEFFGSLSSAPTSRSPAEVELPKAMNSNDTTWWNSVNKNNGDGEGGDRLRHVLLVASIACGVTGSVLLVASGLVYFVRYKNAKPSSSQTESNSKAIVISK